MIANKQYGVDTAWRVRTLWYIICYRLWQKQAEVADDKTAEIS